MVAVTTQHYDLTSLSPIPPNPYADEDGVDRLENDLDSLAVWAGTAHEKATSLDWDGALAALDRVANGIGEARDELIRRKDQRS